MHMQHMVLKKDKSSGICQHVWASSDSRWLFSSYISAQLCSWAEARAIHTYTSPRSYLATLEKIIPQLREERTKLRFEFKLFLSLSFLSSVNLATQPFSTIFVTSGSPFPNFIPSASMQQPKWPLEESVVMLEGASRSMGTVGQESFLEGKLWPSPFPTKKPNTFHKLSYHCDPLAPKSPKARNNAKGTAANEHIGASLPEWNSWIFARKSSFTVHQSMQAPIMVFLSAPNTNLLEGLQAKRARTPSNAPTFSTSLKLLKASNSRKDHSWVSVDHAPQQLLFGPVHGMTWSWFASQSSFEEIW